MPNKPTPVLLVTPENAPFIPGSAADPTCHSATVAGIATNNLFHDLADTNDPLLQRTLTAIRKNSSAYSGGLVALTIGYMSRYQGQLAAASARPIISSPLLAVPMLLATLPHDTYVLVIYADSRIAIAEDMPGIPQDRSHSVLIAGLEGPGPFRGAVIERTSPFDALAVTKQIESLITAQRQTHNIGAVVLECGEMAATAKELRARLDIPVVDYHLVTGFFAEAMHSGTP